MCVKCPFNKKNKLPPCLVIDNHKWWYLKDFLLNKNKNEEFLSIIHKIWCINKEWNYIQIKQDKCIKCLFCVVNCPQNLISIKKDIILKEFCNEDCEKPYLDISISDSFFNWDLVDIPSLHDLWSTSIKYSSFEKFAETDETQNIAVWGASMVKYLSNDNNSRLWLEIKMIIQSRDRWWRLDICLFSHNHFLFCFETKISFRKMMQENRYISQMINYKEEIQNNLSELDLKEVSNFEILLIDWKESDLLFPDHKDCTSKIWQQANIFYQNLVEHRIFFVSATALRALTLKKLLLNKEKYSLENVFSKIIKEDCFWLLSSWVVVKKDLSFEIKPLDTFL